MTAREWLDVLYARLSERQAELKLYGDYYDGRHRLAFATPKFRATFGPLFKEFADSWCDIVVDASVERLEIQGFRIDGSGDPDEDLWKVWQRNRLDAGSGVAMLEAVKLGTAYALVEPRGTKLPPRITVEHPSQMIVSHDAGDRHVREAALKVWLDKSGHLFATVYLPNEVVKFRSVSTVALGGAQVGSVKWETRPGTPHRVKNPLGVVPVVPLENGGGMLTGGTSDLAKVIPLQDAVNKLTTDLLVASEYVAMPQRWATGVEIPIDPDTGQAMDGEKFLSWVGRVWTVEDDEAKFGQFPESNLDNYVKAVGMLVQHLSAQTRTPPHYLVGQIVNASGDALKAAETGLVSKVKRKMVSLGEGWEEVVRLAFLAQGDTARGAEDTHVEVIWKDPESRSFGEVVDGATKLATIGVPEDALWEMIGATPQQVSRWRVAREAQLLREQALALAGAAPGDNGSGDTGDGGSLPEPVPVAD